MERIAKTQRGLPRNFIGNHDAQDVRTIGNRCKKNSRLVGKIIGGDAGGAQVGVRVIVRVGADNHAVNRAGRGDLGLAIGRGRRGISSGVVFIVDGTGIFFAREEIRRCVSRDDFGAVVIGAVEKFFASVGKNHRLNRKNFNAAENFARQREFHIPEKIFTDIGARELEIFRGEGHGLSRRFGRGEVDAAKNFGGNFATDCGRNFLERLADVAHGKIFNDVKNFLLAASPAPVRNDAQRQFHDV